ncbi:MAG: gluconate 2-dehydrogenase subunit 3 family protein [Bryobacterales bacterium]|jgi:gluconate 2-dehydrogenase gamma chain|nr:gluconate 2-dehydrogenase subunit 3 family protein [Bryobacterales bacterium]
MADPLVTLEGTSRRDLLRTIALGLTAGGAWNLEAAQHVHTAAQTARGASGVYKPRLFPEHQWKTLRRLTELILPADETSGSALDAGAPEFIDLLASENSELAAIFTGGLAWLDAEMRRRAGAMFVDAPAAKQTELLDDLVAAERIERERAAEVSSYERSGYYQSFSEYSAKPGSPLAAGARFFDWARKLTVDAFYTSRIGIKDIDFRGNGAYTKYEVPEASIRYAMQRSPFGA